MKLIVGLGNKGKEYNNTRHNVGFMILDKISDDIGFEFSKEKFNALYCETIIDGEKVIFLKPMEYMNLSGISISKYIKYFNINIDDILIIQDDLDIELGKYKLRSSGNAGGHNGIRSIIDSLNSNEFKRLKIGVSNNKTINTKDYVLGKFNKEETEILNEVIDKSVEIVLNFVKIDFINLMNKYN